MISQVMVPSFAWNEERNDAIRAEMTRMRAASGSDMVLVLFTNTGEKSSELQGIADPDLIRDTFGDKLPSGLRESCRGNWTSSPGSVQGFAVRNGDNPKSVFRVFFSGSGKFKNFP